MKNYDHLNYILYNKYKSFTTRNSLTESLKNLSIDELKYISKKMPKLDISFFVDYEICKKVFPKGKKYIIVIDNNFDQFRARFCWEKPDPLTPEKYIHYLSKSIFKDLELSGRLIIEVKDVQEVKNYFILKDIIT